MRLSTRLRKFIGMIIIIAWLPVYALMVLAVVISRPFAESGIADNAAATFFFYLLAGLLWTILPALLIKWMQKPE